jgi:peptidyl-prolyl cis-trans isomerase SurA
LIKNILKAGTAIALLIGVSATSLNNHPAQAQEVLQKIEALINDEVISAYDVTQRMGLIVATTGGIENQQQFLQLKKQVLETMINERLQLQEAKEWEVNITDDEVAGTYSRIAQNMGKTTDELDIFLTQYGASKRTLINQVKAEFAWQTLVQGRLGSQVVISDEEVDDYLARMKANTGKFEYRMGEIFLVVSNPERDADVKLNGERLIKQIAEGANFQQIARQFSQSSSAASGGDMGWIQEGSLNEPLEAEIKKLEVGQYTKEPIKTPGGYYILGLSDRRKILSIDPLDVTLDLRQIYLAFTAETTQEQAEAMVKQVTDLDTSTYAGCENIERLALTVKATTHGSLGDGIVLRQLNPELRNFVEGLSIGEPSKPSLSKDGLRVFYVCGRTEPTVRMPTADEIFNQLEQKRLAMMARRYLRDIRRDAIIDMR